jgi:hypothetical protein
VTLFLRRAGRVAGVQPGDYHHAPTSGVAD